MSIQLKAPFSISARLLPSLVTCGVTISLERLPNRSPDNRDIFRYTIDNLPNRKRPVVGSDLQSGCGGGGLQETFESLLSFLGAAGEAYPNRENADLFPKAVCEWAKANSDELAILQCEIQENKDLITES